MLRHVTMFTQLPVHMRVYVSVCVHEPTWAGDGERADRKCDLGGAHGLILTSGREHSCLFPTRSKGTDLLVMGKLFHS